jgi:class 3 adenylate cyclase
LRSRGMAEPIQVGRRLIAVFAADVEGYSRLMGVDEVGTLKGVTERRAILDKAIADHRGRIAAYLRSSAAPWTLCSARSQHRLRWPKRTRAYQ